MANLVGQLGQTIKGSVANFGAGFKQAAISGNPALFGAGLGAIEKAFQRTSKEDKAERNKDREERRRDKQFNEENQNEQRKLDNDILGTLKSIEKSVEAILKILDKKDKAGFGLGPLLLLGKGLEALTKGFKLFVDGFKKFFTVKIPDFFKSIFDKIKVPKIADTIGKLLGSLADMFKTAFEKLKLKFAERFPKLQKGIDEIFDVIRASIRFIGNIITDLFNRVAQLITRITPSIPGMARPAASKAPTIKQEGTRFRSTETGKFVSADAAKSAGFIDDAGGVVKGLNAATDAAKVGIVASGLAKVLGVFKGIGDTLGGSLKIFGEITDVAAFVKGIGKVFLPLGILISVIDGIFAAIDTTTLEKQFGPGNVGIQQRIAAFIGGFIGSIGGLFDVLGKLMGIDTGEGENSIQGQLTAFFTKVSDEILGGISSFFKLIGAIITSEPMQAIWAASKELFGKGVEIITAGLGALFSLFKDVFMSDTMMYIYKTVGAIIGNNVTMALKALGTIIDFIIGLITFDTSKMSKAVGDFSSLIVEGLGNVLKIVANAMIEGINAIIDGLPLISQERKDKMKLSKFAMLTQKDTQLNALAAQVNARPKDAKDAKEWDKQYGKNYDASGKLKAGTLQEQLQLRKLIADGMYDALKRPGSLSVSEALNINAKVAQEEYEWQQDQARKTEQYRAERDGLQKRFYETLDNNFQNMFTKMAGPGGFGSTAPGGARSAIETAIGPAFQKLGTKIFGKEMGGDMGQIFTQLFGSYGDQIATQVLGPALFGGGKAGGEQANRFFNSLASGNKKNAMEDLIYGMTGVSTGSRSAMGYESGMKDMAKELAQVVGAPFDPLFGLDDAARQRQEQADAISQPVVDAIDRQTEALITPPSRVGGGSVIYDAAGNPIAQSQGTFSGGYGGRGSASGMAGAQGASFIPGMPATSKALVNLGGQFIGRKLGVNTGTFGGQLAQAGLSTALQTALGGGDIMSALNSINMISGAGKAISDFGVNQILNQGMLAGSGSSIAAFGQGMTAGSSGAGIAGAKGAFGSGSTMTGAGQAGYVAGVIGSAMTAKSISDAFSGGYKSGVGDAVAVIGSFFDPTGGFIAGAVGGFVNRLFGRKAPQVTDTGITGTLKTDSASLKSYTDILEKGGTYRSDKRYTNYGELPAELVKGISNALGELTGGIKDVGRIMGFDRPKRNEVFASTQRTVKLSDYSKEDQKFIKGLKEGTVARLPSGELVRVDAFVKGKDEMRDVYREYGDSGQWEQELVKGVTEAVTYTTVSAGDAYRAAYRKLLEGNFEQQVRVSLKGKSDEEIKEALQKMVEDFADAYIKDAFGNVLDKFQKQGERLFETFDRLAKATEAITDITMKLGYEFEFLNLHMDEFAAADLASTFFDLAGGVDAYAKNVQWYFENFYTNEEQLEYVAEKGRQAMQASLEKVGLDAAMSVEGLTDMMGENFEDARKAYRKVVEDFIDANGGMEEIVRKGDPQVIEQLAKLQGDLAQEYYATTKALQELERIKGTSKEALTGAARAIFMADMAAMGRSFATGGVASGPKSGYGAMLHGTEAVVPLPNGREIPVELKFPTSELGLNRTYINNIVGNGNATVRSNPTNVITSPPQATSGSSPNRVLTSAY
jgi:hypothetical protein